jgi:hypothetical protein
MAGIPEASASTASASTGETVIVTATGLVNAVAAVLGVGGTILSQFHIINGVEAVIPAAVEPVLAAVSQSAALLLPALPGTTVQLSPNGPVSTWNPSLWSGTSWPPGPSDTSTWSGWAWNGGDWNGWTWTGRAWNVGDWAGATWNGADWAGRAWNDAGWAGSAFNGRAWNGSAWNSSAWN